MSELSILEAAKILENKVGRTLNGGGTNLSSLDKLVDFFFLMGAARNQPDSVVENAFKASLEEAGIEKTVRAVLHARNIRGGLGERRLFNVCMNCLLFIASSNKEMEDLIDTNLPKLLNAIVEVGRWDDLFVFFGTKYQKEVVKFWLATTFVLSDDPKIKAIQYSRSGLAAKWLPMPIKVATKIAKLKKNERYQEDPVLLEEAIADIRHRAKVFKSKYVKPFLMESGFTEEQYRKAVVERRNTVETKMCEQDWNSINFAHVPSKAALTYSRAFDRNAPEKYAEYKENLKAGKTKVNSSVLCPHEIIAEVIKGGTDQSVLQAMWDSLPNYMEGSTERILPIVDVSSSMSDRDAKVTNTIKALHIAVALGMYISERNEGVLKNLVMNFHDNPQLFQMEEGSLAHRWYTMNRLPWGGRTNLLATFVMLARMHVEMKVPKEQMPTKLLIVSDMEFDRAFMRTGLDINTVFDDIKSMFNNYNLEVPQIVFWKVNTRNTKNVPVTINDDGVALVSGFSPSILKNVLGNKLNPLDVVLEAISDNKYDWTN